VLLTLIIGLTLPTKAIVPAQVDSSSPGNGPPRNGPPGNSSPGNGPPRNGPPGNSSPGNGPPRNGPPGNSSPGNGPPRNGPPGSSASVPFEAEETMGLVVLGGYLFYRYCKKRKQASNQ
jgi:hypothetical protein